MNYGEGTRGAIGKLLYAAVVTTFCIFLAGWALLAHQGVSQSAKKSGSDEQFAKKAAQGGMAEVKMGELAQEKGTNEAVKKFGQRMTQDHTKAGDGLRQAAMVSREEMQRRLLATFREEAAEHLQVQDVW